MPNKTVKSVSYELPFDVEVQQLTEKLAKRKVFYEIKTLLRDDNETVIIYLKVFTIILFCKRCHFRGVYNPSKARRKHEGMCQDEIHHKLIAMELFYTFVDAIQFLKNYENRKIKD